MNQEGDGDRTQGLGSVREDGRRSDSCDLWLRAVADEAKNVVWGLIVFVWAAEHHGSSLHLSFHLCVFFPKLTRIVMVSD